MDTIDLILQGHENLEQAHDEENNNYTPKVETCAVYNLLIKQYQAEEMNSRLYYQFYIWLKQAGFKCSSVWLKFSEEEKEHAKLILDFLIDYNKETIMLPEISAIVNVPLSLYDVVLATLNSETDNMNRLMELNKNCKQYIDEGDYGLQKLLNELMREQHEEVHKAKIIMEILSRSNDLLQIDEYIANNF